MGAVRRKKKLKLVKMDTHTKKAKPERGDMMKKKNYNSLLLMSH